MGNEPFQLHASKLVHLRRQCVAVMNSNINPEVRIIILKSGSAFMILMNKMEAGSREPITNDTTRCTSWLESDVIMQLPLMQ